jgi:Aspartyl protease
MRHSISNVPIQAFLSIGMATMAVSVLQAESHCPGNVASVTPRFVQRALIVVPAEINHTGPYDFMVDTGAQITVIDPSVALQLDLKPQGTVGLVAVASYSQASIGMLDTLEADSHVVEKPLVVVQDLGQIQAADPRIRGVLGENFLAHFDLLIDYEHKLLCLDDTKESQKKVRGERIPLLTPKHPEDQLPFTERLVIAVYLSGTGSRQILLQVDSGSDGPILYASNTENELPLLKRATIQGSNSSKAQQAFALLPPQDMRIGSRTLSKIPFVTPVSTAQSVREREEDGVLPTVLFQSVYVSFADHFVVFNAK